jgi:hypothetical protein
MKKLFYNPIEKPHEVHVFSEAFNIDVTYNLSNCGNKPITFDELFTLAKLNYIDKVEVNCTPHNQAYYRDSKQQTKRYDIDGWIDLKEYKNGGGYTEDKYKHYDFII